ncbi:MAG: MBL fold metallo-hydrolase [Ruminiclostridium sp.]|nr:MBL fold metallo-hydrolase [Ruminiclostridium sp.]
MNLRKRILPLLLALTLCLPVAAGATQTVGVTLDGQAVAFDETYGYPFIDSAGRTQVPFRVTLETFGCTVDWNNDTRTAWAEKDGVVVEVPIGQAYILVNGRQVPIDTTSLIQGDRTYLPIRAVLEAFGAYVTWNNDTRQVVATTGLPLVRVHFIEVGQGDAALIDAGELEVLIDAGTNKAGPRLVEYLTGHVDGILDYVIATHPDHDHIGGLDDVLTAFQVGEIIDSGYPNTTQSWVDYWAAVEAEPDCLLSFDEDRVIPLNETAYLEIIETGDHWTASNDMSVIAQLVCGEVEVLFTGDMTATAERESLSLFRDVDVLKIGHHGSKTSTSQEFLEVIRPEYAVAPYKQGNSYGHPTAVVLQRLFDMGTTVYGTGKSGNVVLTTNGLDYSFNTTNALTIHDAGT